MADRALGVSFSPTFDNAEQARRGQAGAGPAGAIQTLNFRLPKFTGGGGLSPLQTDTPRSTFGGAVLQSVLRTILGVEDAAQYGGMDYAGVGGDGRDSGAAMLAALTGFGGAGGGGRTEGAPAFGLLGGGGDSRPSVRPGDQGDRTDIPTGFPQATTPSFSSSPGYDSYQQPFDRQDIY
jgi:hypothetical protein